MKNILERRAVMFDLDFWIHVLCTIVAMNLYKYLYLKFFTNGTLRIDHSDPDAGLYHITIKDIDTVSKKKRIVLKVDSNAKLSQK